MPRSKLPRPTEESVAYYLGVAYAANIGGTGTLTGTATNLTFKGLYERYSIPHSSSRLETVTLSTDSMRNTPDNSRKL